MLEQSDFANFIALSLMPEILKQIADHDERKSKQNLSGKQKVDADESSRNSENMQKGVNRVSMTLTVINYESYDWSHCGQTPLCFFVNGTSK
jgi:hypothetical protein